MALSFMDSHTCGTRSKAVTLRLTHTIELTTHTAQNFRFHMLVIILHFTHFNIKYSLFKCVISFEWQIANGRFQKCAELWRERKSTSHSTARETI